MCWAASKGEGGSGVGLGGGGFVYLCFLVFKYVFVSNFLYGFLISTSVVRSVKVGGAGCAGRPREKEALALGGASFPPPAASWWEPSEGGDQW